MSTEPPIQAWFPSAPKFSLNTDKIIRVSNVKELFDAVNNAEKGTIILIADGFYQMPSYLEITTDNLTLMGESGHREKVIIDGSKSIHGELIGITRCSGVTIANLTIQNIKWNGFKLNTNTNVQNVTIYNCIIHNIWQRGVKAVLIPEGDRENIRPKNCKVQYCLFYNDRQKQYSDDPADTDENFGGNYIGGIDIMYATNWVISDNVFICIQGRTRSARGAIFTWHESRNCIIERNIIIDCDTGIALGNSFKRPDTPVHCSGFIVRNNFVTRAPENGILADYTYDCKIVNNTIHDPENRLGRLIRLVHDNDGLLVANNIISGPKIRNESKSKITFINNLEKELTGYFVDPEHGNLHLKGKIDDVAGKAMLLSEVTEDIDRNPRPKNPSIGAHEINN